MLEAFQRAVFAKVTEEIKHKFPDNSLTLTYASLPIIEDFGTLSSQGKLRWDPCLKSRPFFSPEQKHQIKLAVYYRWTPVGYAFGNFSEERSSVEICWMEKRNDAHHDLDHQFLPIALSAFSAYALLLRSQGYSVNKIAMVSPVDDVQSYYYSHASFRYVADYDSSICAMVLDMA